MNTKKIGLWVTLLATSCFVAGCGGEGGTAAAATDTQAARPVAESFQVSHTSITEYPNEAISSEALQPAKPDAGFAGKDMAALLPNNSNCFFNSAIKLLLAAVGPQSLVDHLQHIEQQTEDPGKRLAASRFIALIGKLYQSDSPVSALELMESLQALAPFDALDLQGRLETELKTAAIDPIDFLVQLDELFALKDLPGRTLATSGAAAQDAGSALFHPIEVATPVQQDVQLPLQQALDLLHQAGRPAQEWSMPSMRTADIAQFKELTILPPSDGMHWFQFHTSAHFSLPVFDEKTWQSMLVTLTPKAILMLDEQLYHVFLKGSAGNWYQHYDATIAPLQDGETQSTLQALTLEVVSAVPMP